MVMMMERKEMNRNLHLDGKVVLVAPLLLYFRDLLVCRSQIVLRFHLRLLLILSSFQHEFVVILLALLCAVDAQLLPILMDQEEEEKQEEEKEKEEEKSEEVDAEEGERVQESQKQTRQQKRICERKEKREY